MFRNSILIILLFVCISAFSQNLKNDNFDVKYCRFEWTLNPEVFYIKGIVTTHFEVVKPTNQIVFELIDNLTVDSVIYHETKLNFEHLNNLLILNFNGELPEGNFDSVSVYYQGIPTTTNSRAFEIKTHSEIPILWTLSEPYGAKDWMPCKQTLNDKIDSIDMFITAPKGYKVAGNGILVSENIIGENKITHWTHKHPIAIYLIGIAITNYTAYSDFVPLENGDTLEILNYVYPEEVEYAKTNTPNVIDVLQYYSDNFLTYPFERYGHAQFEWGGGMEHQTMSFMGSFTHPLMAHELAHQWFGDYITCGSWQDIWLNESFATYLEGLTAEQGLAEYTWLDWKKNKIYEATLTDDGSVYIYDTISHTTIFNYNMVYSKGAMVLNTLRTQLGDSIFFQSIRNYLSDESLAYGYAKTEDIKRHFEKTSGENLTEFFNDWIYSEGYPIYEILWHQDKNNEVIIIVNQEQSHESVDFFELDIPVCFKNNFTDTLLILTNSFSGQVFTANIDFKIKSGIFDPEKNIISKGSEINEFFENMPEFVYTISPNPVDENINIEFPIDVELQKIVFYNSEGKEIYSEKINKLLNQYTLNTSKLKEGIYIIEIILEKQKLTDKIVINHE